MGPLIRAQIKEVAYEGQEAPVLRNIDLSISQGEFVVVTGSVASGKSTLCHCLTGAVPKYFPARMEGRVVVAGTDLGGVTLPETAGLVGYMMQDPQNQIFSVSVEEDVAFGPCNLGLSREEVIRRVGNALAFVGLEGFRRRTPETLSGGEAQRAVLAGVMALQPRVFILDQPTAELDPAGREAIYQGLGRLSKSGEVAILIVADRPAELCAYATRYLVLEQGTIVSDSSNYYACPKANNHLKINSHAIANPSTSSNETDLVNNVDIATKATEIARLQECTHTYANGQPGCIDINLSLYQGELVALLGLNGSGKTTVAKHLNGLLKPDQGTVNVAGQNTMKTTVSQLSQHVGFLYQNPDYQIFAGTVEEEVSFGLSKSGLSGQQIRLRAEEVLRQTELLAFKDWHPHRLSRGQRQLLALASILATNPDLIIADEPTAGLHTEIAENIMRLLSKRVGQGKTVLLVTHDLDLAGRFAHRLVAMHNHRMVIDIPNSEVAMNSDRFAEIGLDFGPREGGEIKHGCI